MGLQAAKCRSKWQTTLRGKYNLAKKWPFDFAQPDTHILQGWPAEIADLVKNGTIKIPRRMPQIISAGFQEKVDNPFREILGLTFNKNQLCSNTIFGL